jgi:hypothetical protein
MAQDDTLPLLLLVAAGVGVYLYLRPPPAGQPLAATAQQAVTDVETWLASLTSPSPPPALAAAETWGASVIGRSTPGVSAPGAGVPAPGAGVASPVAIAPTPLPATGVLVPIAVAAGATGAVLSDLDTARMIEGLTLSVVQNGGKVVQALQLADLGQVLQIVGTVGLVVDMVFTVLGNASDAQKAFDTALDAVLIACLWIPVYGWALALVVGIIKMIGDLFGFSQGLTHAQREALERARYGDALAPMLADLAHAFSPREMVRVLMDWGSGACGGTHAVAMAPYMRDAQTGQLWYFGNAGCYYWAQARGVQYRGQVLDGAPLSLDAQALALVQYGGTDFAAEAQVGIREDLKTIFNEQIVARVTQKLPFWQGILAQGGTLDTLDVVAEEIRLTPDLTALAAFYGWASWQAGLAAMLQPQWTAYHDAHLTGGTLSDFARQHGYPDLRAWRTALFAPLWPAWQRWHQVLDGYAAVVDRIERPFGILSLAASINPGDLSGISPGAP